MSRVYRQVQVQVTEQGATDFSGTLLTLDAQIANGGSDAITLTPRVYPLEGRTESRTITLRIIDAANVITGDLADADGRMDWLGRLCRVRVLDTVDGVAGSWTAKASGRVQRMFQSSPGLWLIEVTDERWRERNFDVFATDATTTDGTEVGGTTIILPWGLVYRFADAWSMNAQSLDHYPEYEVVDTSPITLERTFYDTYHGHDVQVSIDALRALDFDADGEGPSKVRAIIHDGASYDMDATITAIRTGLFGAGLTGWEPGDVFQIVIGSTSHTLSNGDTVRAVIRSWGAGPAENIPLHIGVGDASHFYGSADGRLGLDPIDLVELLYDAAGIRYASAAMDALRGKYERQRFRVTEKSVLADWLDKNIYRPLQIVALINGDGEVSPVSLRPPVDLDPATLDTLTAGDFIEPHPTFDSNASNQVNRIVVRGFHYTEVYDLADGLDGIDVAEVKIERDDPNYVAGTPIQAITIDVPGVPNLPGITLDPADPQPSRFDAFAERLTEEVFDRLASPIIGEGWIKPTAPTLTPGEFYVVDLDSYPNPSVNDYGSPRIVQAIEVEEYLDGRRKIRWLDAGPELQPLDEPVVVLGLTVGNPKHSIDVTVSTLDAGEFAQVEFAVAAVEPDADSSDWHAAHTAEIGNETFAIPRLPSGSDIWVRPRTRAPNRTRSPWTASETITTDALTPPSAPTLTVTNTSVMGTFTPGESDYPIMPTLDGEDFLTTPLPAGSGVYVWEGLEPSTLYTFGVKHIDAYGGASAIASDTETTGTAPTLTDPASVTLEQYRASTTDTGLGDGSNGYGFAVAVSAPSPSADIVIQVSTSNVFATIDKQYRFAPGDQVPSLLLTGLTYNNTLRYIRARYEKAGWVESSWVASSPASGYVTPLSPGF